MPREGPSLRRTTDLSTPKTEEHSCYSLHHRRGKHPSNPKCSSSSSAQTHPGAPLERSSSSFSQEKPDAIDDPKGKLKLIDAEEKLKVNGSIVNLNINYREEELEIESEETLNIVSDRKVKNNYEGNSSVCATSGQSSTYLSGAERVGEDVIRQRLDSLHIADSAVDDELSELQQEANKQEQQDEILALQAILGEDFITLEGNDSSTHVFMVSIHVPPTSLVVTLKLPDDSYRSLSDALDQDGQNKIRACSLEILPPIYLIYRMPRSYPSNRQPHFVLSANWLSKDALEKLCQGLDALWQEQVGNVVIFSWADWLQTTCLSYLGITNELELDFGPGGKTHDDRVVLYQSSPDRLIQFLIRYNEDRKNDMFLKSTHTCCICFGELSGKDFVRLPCKHFFCIGCTKQYVTINVKEGTVKRLKCMDTTCKDSIPPSVLKQLLSDSEFVRWEDLLLQKTLDSMIDVVYCPRCEVVCIEEEDHFTQCIHCLFSFCSLCKGPRHVGRECLSAEARLHLLKERQQRSHGGADTRRKEQDYLNELMNLKYVQEQTKQCPACKMAITKFEGCNKVTCGNCGQYFCYRCNKAIEGYDHFREGCVLFDDEEIQRWERAMHVGRNAGPDVRAGVALRTCPNCRQENLKEGNNNHIFCWSCQQHFCALCRKIVRRSSEHYGPNKCKQHTAD